MHFLYGPECKNSGRVANVDFLNGPKLEIFWMVQKVKNLELSRMKKKNLKVSIRLKLFNDFFLPETKCTAKPWFEPPGACLIKL